MLTWRKIYKWFSDKIRRPKAEKDFMTQITEMKLGSRTPLDLLCEAVERNR